MEQVTAWRDAAALATASSWPAGRHTIGLVQGLPLQVTVPAGAFSPATTYVPVLLGTVFPSRRGPVGPYWGAGRLATTLGSAIVVADPTPYATRERGIQWFLGHGGARDALVEVGRTVGRLSGRPPLWVAGGHLATAVIAIAAATDGAALVWNPAGELEPTPTGARAAGTRVAEVDDDLPAVPDLCDVELPARLLIVQNGDDATIAGSVGPFLDEHSMRADPDSGCYTCGDDRVVVFPALGAGVSEVAETAVARLVAALSGHERSVLAALRSTDSLWEAHAVPRDLRPQTDRIATSVSLTVAEGASLTAAVRWAGEPPAGVRCEVVAYGAGGRLWTRAAADGISAQWPLSAGVTHVVAHLTDECGHELVTLRHQAPFNGPARP